MTWNSWSNRAYSVFSATDLVSQPWTCIASNVLPTPPLNVWTNTTTSPNRAFFRVIGEFALKGFGPGAGLSLKALSEFAVDVLP